jgi:hypothetical protein
MRRRCVLRVVFVSYASSSGLTPRGWDLARPLVGEFQARVVFLKLHPHFFIFQLNIWDLTSL